jgi:hypothetical protein
VTGREREKGNRHNQMDLSMSEDFDSSLLEWEEDGRQQRQPDSEGMGSGSTPKQQTLTPQAMKEGFSRLPSFPTSIGGYSASNEPQQSNNDAHGLATTGNQMNPYAMMQMLYPLTGHTSAGTQQQQQQNLMVQYALTGQSNGDPFPTVSFPNNKNYMDTVSCLSTTTGGYASSAARSSKPAASEQPGDQQRANQVNRAMPTSQLHPLGIQSSAGCPSMTVTAPPGPLSTPNAAPAMQFNPYMFNPYNMAMAGNPQLFAAYQSSQQQQQLAAHFAAAQASVAQATTAQAPPSTLAKPSDAALPPPAPVAKAPSKQKKPKAAAVKAKKTSVKKKKDDTPPFLLFDAPCELRQNFMATQRMLNLPVHHDGNSFHYGMAVNGFHPQLNGTTDPVQLPTGVKLLDSRHKQRKGDGKERNEREQKRAQKITELIDQIRTSMEDGGWKVEMKSKYHTLTMCADYVKHLIKTTEEKEEAVEKAKSDLEVKERKLEEDKALLEGRSDPESVTSTLTASSEGSRGGGAAASGNAKPVSDDTSSRHKRKAQDMEAMDMNKVDFKKVKTQESSADLSAADEGGNGSGPSGHNISIGKMSSSVSELTDSNRGSSDSGGEKTGRNGNAAHKKHPRSDEEGEGSDFQSGRSISSTAALFRGTQSHNRDHGHADVVIREKKHFRRRFRSERSSLDRKFEINYEEVFLTSNVPQIIATTAGRIVTWNKFFLDATCLDESSVQRLTIFSLVQQDKLANLFEMVAEALRRKAANADSTSGTSSSGTTTKDSPPSSSDATEANSHVEKYATMTLPCTSVLSARTDSDSSGGVTANPLYMTITLMPDEDVRKRCFHCVFTDYKGSDGRMGFITPELLARLFTGPQSSNEKLQSQKPIATKTRSSNKEAKGKEIHVNDAAVDNGDDDSD